LASPFRSSAPSPPACIPGCGAGATPAVRDGRGHFRVRLRHGRELLAARYALSVAIADAASPASSLRFLYGAGLVVIPVIIVYTACVYWVFRGKVRAEMLYD
jgi:hypothetical protein